MQLLTTFAKLSEFEKAKELISSLSLPFEVISPVPGYCNVGVPAIVLDEDVRREIAAGNPDQYISSGWVDYHEPLKSVPDVAPRIFEQDVFGKAAIMVLQPCAADEKKLRIVAHISGDLTEVFPFMNAVISNAFYNKNGPTFTLMDGHRIIALYPHRIAIAKTDDIVDTWRILEFLRIRANECWRDRAGIIPDYTLHKKPPALEIYYRLPRVNCGECGEKTCMAFTLKLWSGQILLSKCKPVFEGKSGHLKDALVEICGGLGVEKG